MLDIIVNPAARGGHSRQIWERVERRLQETQVDYRVHITEALGEAEEIARRLTACSHEQRGVSRTIVVMGGDGTLNEVLQGLTLKQPVTLGYIQCGSGNDFARGMHLERDPMRMLERILHPKYFKVIDYGIAEAGACPADYRRYLVSSGIGWDAAICQELKDSSIRSVLNKIHLGKLGYLVAGIKQWVLCKPVDGMLVLDGNRKISLKRMYFLSAHNLQYEGGGFMFAPGAVPDDGLLQICVMSHMGKLRMVPAVLLSLFGRQNMIKGVQLYSCREAKVVLDRPMTVHTDGECRGMHQEYAVSCQKKKIRLIV